MAFPFSCKHAKNPVAISGGSPFEEEKDCEDTARRTSRVGLSLSG